MRGALAVIFWVARCVTTGGRANPRHPFPGRSLGSLDHRCYRVLHI
jgi:hypothetical protein